MNPFESEALYRRLVDHAPLGVLSADRTGRIRTVNRRLLEMLGSPSEEFTRSVNLLTFPNLVEAGISEVARRCIETGEDGTGELPYVSAFGRHVRFRFHFAPLLGAGGRIEGLHALVEDVTDTHATEDALRESRRMLRLVLDAIPTRVFWKDREHRFLGCNRAFAEDGGLADPELIVGLDDDDMAWAEQAELYRADDRKVMASGEPRVGYEEPQTRPDGSRVWLRTSKVPLRDADGAIVGVLGTYEDITEAKALEAEREQLQGRLRHAQTMEAVGTLAGGVAHDFNNLLLAIMGYNDLALDGLDPASPVREDLLEVRRAAEQARRLVERILTIGRRSEREPRAVDLAGPVREALALLRAGLPSTITIETELCAEPVVVRADPTELHQLVMNLGTNAGQAMPAGGTLRVGLEPAPDGQTAHLWFRDTGCGMDAETAARIFEPYFTTKESGHGTGLGLAVVHGIVQALGATVDVDSRPGAGATFHVHIPLCGEAPAGQAAGAPHVAGGSERVLFVDDEASLRRWGERCLAGLGYRVETCADGDEALARVEAGHFDAVVTDQTMPGRTGVELARLLRERRPGLAVLLLTGLLDSDTADAARRNGVAHCLAKPLSRNDLARALRAALDERDAARDGPR